MCNLNGVSVERDVSERVSPDRFWQGITDSEVTCSKHHDHLQGCKGRMKDQIPSKPNPRKNKKNSRRHKS